MRKSPKRRFFVIVSHMRISTSEIKWQTFRLAVTEYLPEVINHEVLILHGAGEAEQSRTKNLATALTILNCRTITFDFVSHRLSSGALSDLTLKKRSEQALTVYKHFALSSNCILLGFSMSGQTAVDLMTMLDGQVSTLALFAPAFYDKDARTAHFGPDFSSIIRKDESWKRSDAWEKMSKFRGALITFESPLDSIVPDMVIDLLQKSAINATLRLRVRVKNAPHTMALWSSQDPLRAEWFADTIVRAAEGVSKPDIDLAQKIGIELELL